jgi:DNA-binding HxlR family transcriptional regulator
MASNGEPGSAGLEWRGAHSFVGLIGGRWTLVLLAKLAGGGRRYQDLHGALEGISHKVLTDTLRRAERHGLISRHVDAGRMDTATIYVLTDLGRSLDEPLGALGRWVEANWDSVEAAQRDWASRTTSTLSAPPLSPGYRRTL